MSDRAEVVRTFWIDVWTHGRVDLLPEIFADGARENGEPVDLNAFRAGVIATRASFPDFSVRVEELLEAEPDRVISRILYSGTQAGPYLGLPPFGRRFEVIGIDVFRVNEGRISELWHSVDHLSILAMLGGKVVPRDEQ